MLSIAGELLSNAEGLLRDGLHTAEVADGYVQAAAKARQLYGPRLKRSQGHGPIL